MAIETRFQRALRYAMQAAEDAGDVDLLSKAIRTVVRVHAAQGIIDNGGLQYFFEADFPGKPDYAVFVEAYWTIGAGAEASVLRQAISLFPFKAPHKHVKKRNQFLDSFLDDDGEPVNSPFESLSHRLCGNKSVLKKLKSYCMQHQRDLIIPKDGSSKTPKH